MGIALSTAWNAFRHKAGLEIISEITALGFKEAELSFNLTQKIVEGIRKETAAKKIRVLSLHNYCPIPEKLKRSAALPDCYSLASLDQKERAQALRYTKATIDTAGSLGAKAVVLHCGRVKVPDRTGDFIKLYNRGEIHTSKALDLKSQADKEREKKASFYFAKAVDSLKELSSYAKKSNIKLGIENRYYFPEIPSFQEFALLFDYFKNDNIFYWHDTGHAQLWENLGFIRHEEYLKCYSKRLAGIHLHDIKGTRDHKAPATGDFDFRMLKQYIKKDTLLTIEAHHPATAIEIISAKKYLEKILCTPSGSRQ